MRQYQEYENNILEVISKYNIFTIQMIFSFYSGISRSQFYELNLNESDTLKGALDDNKNRTKHSMLSKWEKSDNATLQIGLFKLICTPEERKSLSQVHTDMTSNGQSVATVLKGIDPPNEEH